MPGWCAATYRAITCWEKPIKIFSQISPKRSPETQKGPDPFPDQALDLLFHCRGGGI